MSLKPPRQSLAPRLLQVASLPAPSATMDAEKTATAGVRRMTSRALLGGASSLVIDHEGVSYVLRATRLGKLILTK